MYNDNDGDDDNDDDDDDSQLRCDVTPTSRINEQAIMIFLLNFRYIFI